MVVMELWNDLSLFLSLSFSLFLSLSLSLCSCLSGTLEFRSIIEPIRNAGFRDEHDFHLSRAISLDMANQLVECESELDSSIKYKLSYDYLVIGVGAMPGTFGIPGVEEHTFFLKVSVIVIVWDESQVCCSAIILAKFCNVLFCR